MKTTQTNKTAKVKATKTKTTNLIVIDASASMQSKVDEVKGGLKQLLGDIKRDATRDKKKVDTTTIVLDFSSGGDIRVLINSNDSTLLTEDIANNYSTRGMTALYDAIGKGFSLIPANQDSVFVTIITDGVENDSKEVKVEDVKKLISNAKDKKWAVTFMGTTEQAATAAQSWGISKGNTMTYDNTIAGTKKALNKMSSARQSYMSVNSTRSAGQTVTMDNLMED